MIEWQSQAAPATTIEYEPNDDVQRKTLVVSSWALQARQLFRATQRVQIIPAVLQVRAIWMKVLPFVYQH